MPCSWPCRFAVDEVWECFDGLVGIVLVCCCTVVPALSVVLTLVFSWEVVVVCTSVAACGMWWYCEYLVLITPVSRAR